MFVFVCVIVTWLCGLSVIYYAMLYGLVDVVLFPCCCVVFVRVCFATSVLMRVLVRFAYNISCDGVCCVFLCVLCLCVCVNCACVMCSRFIVVVYGLFCLCVFVYMFVGFVLEYCVLFSGACVSAMLLCLSSWSGLNVFVWFVCAVCVMMCGMRLCVVCVCV